MVENSGPLLSVKNLVTSFRTEDGKITPVNGVGFDIKRGETLALVGESGSGKSVTALSIIRLIPKPQGEIESGKIEFDDKNLLTISEEEMRKIRGNRIGMIFQEPMSALNPVFTVGDQISETLILHQGLRRSEGLKRSIELLSLVGIPDPERRVKAYPHQLSGGMRQRVMIAIALSCRPELLIADEPTTALDVTVQAQILKLIKKMQHELSTSMLLVTHDLGVVYENCDSVAVMYAGKIVERARVKELSKNPKRPYTVGLMASIPRLDERRAILPTIPGMVPSLLNLPKGCSFKNRCPYAVDMCGEIEQTLKELSSGHFTACMRASEI